MAAYSDVSKHPIKYIFLKRRSFLSYKLFVVIYTKECIKLQIRKVHYIRHIIGTSTDWFSVWSADGVKVKDIRHSSLP